MHHDFVRPGVERLLLLLEISARDDAGSFLSDRLDEEPVAAQTLAHRQHDVLQKGV